MIDLNALQDIIGYRHEIYANRGINLINLQRFEEAVVEFEKSISLQHNNSFAYYNRSVAYYKMGQYQKAVADIQKAIELAPENAFYHETYNLLYKNIRLDDQ